MYIYFLHVFYTFLYLNFSNTENKNFQVVKYFLVVHIWITVNLLGSFCFGFVCRKLDTLYLYQIYAHVDYIPFRT